MPSLRNENRIRGYAKIRTANDADQYQYIAANNTTALGGANQGDYLDNLLCMVTDVGNAQVQIKDGSGTAITVQPKVLPAGNKTVSIPIGLTAVSNNWTVITDTGVAVLARGVW